MLLTRLAAERLIADPNTPAGFRQWLGDACPDRLDLSGEKAFLLSKRIGPVPRATDGLAFWSTVPDLEAAANAAPGQEVQPFNVSERLLHYIDVEFFVPDESKRRYADDLSGKPAVTDFPRDIHDPRYPRAGMLPFRVKQCYQKLVENFRAGRLNDKPGQLPRDEHAAHWAGFLAHYLEDNTQPHHATVDYRSSHYFREKRTAPNVHVDMEWRLVDDDAADFPALRAEFWDEFVRELDVPDPTKTDDLWQATLEVSLASYDALPLIGHAAAAAYGEAESPPLRPFDAEVFFHFKGVAWGREMTVLQMKARQMAWAVNRVERVWSKAWEESQSARNSDTR